MDDRSDKNINESQNVLVLPYAEGVCLPESNTKIARYFSRDKAYKLVKDYGIWFSRYDLFEDKMEGVDHRAFYPVEEKPDQGLQHEIRDSHQKSFPPLVSCWTQFDGDPDLELWNKYGCKDGICCVTTVGDLQASLNSEDAIPAGYVEYIDESTLNSNSLQKRLSRTYFYDKSPDKRSVATTVFFKRDFFSYEREIRFVCFGSGQNMSGVLIPLLKSSQTRVNPFTKIYSGKDTDSKLVELIKEKFDLDVDQIDLGGLSD